MPDRVRVYLPASVAALRGLAAGRPWPAADAFAVTARARREEPDADEEEQEFAAFLDAAQACLDRLTPEDPPRRVVVSADVPATSVVERSGTVPTAVGLTAPVEPAAVAAVHVDDAEAASVVAAARDGADPQLLDDVALAWFDPGEIPTVLAALDAQQR